MDIKKLHPEIDYVHPKASFDVVRDKTNRFGYGSMLVNSVRGLDGDSIKAADIVRDLILWIGVPIDIQCLIENVRTHDLRFLEVTVDLVAIGIHKRNIHEFFFGKSYMSG